MQLSSSRVLLFLFAGIFALVPIDRTLQPNSALDIGSFVKEPSGLSFSTTSGHLYAISDNPSAQYIYEMHLNGTKVQQWHFPSYMDDLEAVACDDVNGKIYVAQEEEMIISSFILPISEGDWEETENGEKQLIPLDDFPVSLEDGDNNSGLEGLSIDTKRDLIYTVFEKKPRAFFTLNFEGEQLDVSYPFFSGDLSGLAYDDQLDRLWVVSDQSKRVFLTDVTCTIVYDYWNVPFSSSEGIAINYQADPPQLYITTDASSFGKPPYLPILASFDMPIVGTGLKYPDNTNTFNPDTPCKGCTEIWEALAQQDAEYNSKVYHQAVIYGIEMVLVIIVMIIPMICIFMFIVVRAVKSYNPDLYKSNNKKHAQPTIWYELFDNPFTKKKTNGKETGQTGMGAIPNNNFEDYHF